MGATFKTTIMQNVKPDIKPFEYTDKSYLIAENIVPMDKPDTEAGTGQIPDIGGAPEPEGDVTVFRGRSVWPVVGILALIVLVVMLFSNGK